MRWPRPKPAPLLKPGLRLKRRRRRSWKRPNVLPRKPVPRPRKPLKKEQQPKREPQPKPRPQQRRAQPPRRPPVRVPQPRRGLRRSVPSGSVSRRRRKPRLKPKAPPRPMRPRPCQKNSCRRSHSSHRRTTMRRRAIRLQTFWKTAAPSKRPRWKSRLSQRRRSVRGAAFYAGLGARIGGRITVPSAVCSAASMPQVRSQELVASRAFFMRSST